MNILKNKKVKDIIIIVFCLLASFRIINSVIDPFIEVKTENNELKAQKEDLVDKNKNLEKSLEQSENSKEMEEAYIRERFHLSNEDELIFVFPKDE